MTDIEKILRTAGVRWADWLRLKYRKNAAKAIARDFGVSHAKAARWLSGTAPTFVDFMLAVKRPGWGIECVRHVMPSLMGPEPGASDDREALIMRRLDATEKALRDVVNQLKEIKHEGLGAASGDRHGGSHDPMGASAAGLGAPTLGLVP